MLVMRAIWSLFVPDIFFSFLSKNNSGRKITVDGQRDLDRIAASVAQARA
jgi:hypothetical protein